TEPVARRPAVRNRLWLWQFLRSSGSSWSLGGLFWRLFGLSGKPIPNQPIQQLRRVLDNEQSGGNVQDNTKDMPGQFMLRIGCERSKSRNLAPSGEIAREIGCLYQGIEEEP